MTPRQLALVKLLLSVLVIVAVCTAVLGILTISELNAEGVRP